MQLYKNKLQLNIIKNAIYGSKSNYVTNYTIVSNKYQL